MSDCDRVPESGPIRRRGDHAARRVRAWASQAAPQTAPCPPSRGHRTSRAGSPRLLAPLLHALFFVAAATQSAIVPLLPRLSHAYGLSPTSTALLLALPGLATLAISMPAGVFADRVGARPVTVGATVLLFTSSVAQAVPSYPVLVAGRLAFGLAFGIVWTAGVAWLSGSRTTSASRQIGAIATSSAVGLVAGPAIGGIVADQLGLSAPFLLVAALAGVLAVLLWRQPAFARSGRTPPRHSMRDFIRVAPRQPGVIAAATTLAIAGAVGGVTQLLVPLELHSAGFSASGTGIAFSASAGLYIVVSAIVVRIGERAMTVRCLACAGLVLALSMLPAALGVGAAGLVGVLLLTTAPRSVVTAVGYPLAAETAANAGLGAGVVIGLLNGTWAIGLVLAPVIAGALDQAVGPAAAYLSAVIPGTLGALWLLARRIPAVAASGPDEPATQEHEPPTAEHELAPAPAG